MSKKSKYQYDDSTKLNTITGNYYWADGIQSTFVACARKAGIKEPTAKGSDFSIFWNKYKGKNNTHPSEIRKVIHWFFEQSRLRFTLKLSTSQEFLKHYFEIIDKMNN
jgi:hypothetical protein